MQPTPEEEARRWLAQAEHDLDDARFNAGGARHNVAAFLAEQAAEKALKAFLYAQGLREVRGHSVLQLGQQTAAFDAALAQVAETAAPLDQYYVPTRYPNGLAPGGVPSLAYTEQDSDRAIGLADQVLAAVRERLTDQR